jgi:branched-chain amino acid transport system substrate-binding protein
MRLTRHALAAVFGLGGIILGAITTAAADDAEGEIRIGQTLPYSGPVSGFGIIGRAQEAYFAKVNAEGARRCLFAAQDGRADPETGRAG